MTDIIRALYDWSPFDPLTNNVLFGFLAWGPEGLGITPLGQAFLDELDAAP